MTTRRRPAVWAWATWALALLLAGLAWPLQELLNARDAQRQFDAEAGRVAAEVVRRMLQLENGLRGLRGAVLAAGERAMTREQVSAYTSSRDLPVEFPGARGFGVVWRVPVDEEAAFVAAARADGWPGFRVRALAPHQGERAILTVVEPVVHNHQAVGLDLASDPARRAALRTAQRSGRTVLSPPVTLVQAAVRGDTGLLLLAPIYHRDAPVATEAEREAATIGWAYAALLIDDMLAGVVPAGAPFKLHLEDDTARPAVLLHDGLAGLVPDAAPARDERLAVFGRQWRLRVQATPAYAESLGQRPPLQAAASVAGLGAIVALLVHARGVGAQRSRRERLEQARRAAIVEGSDDAIIGATLDGVITEWNGGAERLLGYSAQEALGRPMVQLLLPPGREAEDEMLRATVAEGRRVPPFDTTRRRRDGNLIDVSLTAAPILDAEGQCVGLSKTIRDMRDAQRARQALAALNNSLERQVAERTAALDQALREAESSRRFLQALMEASTRVAIIACDAQGTVTFFNRGAELMLGHAAEDVVGVLHAKAFHDMAEMDERAAELGRRFGRPFKRHEVLSDPSTLGEAHDWTYRGKDGREVPVSLVITEIRDEVGTLLGYLGLAHDVTARRQVEHTLRQATARANQANRAKSLFLANMSHEIRTPMNAVIGLSYLLERTALDTTQADHVAKIRAAGRSLLGSINAVLDLSKIEAGEMEIERLPFSPGALLDELARLMAVQADARRIGFALRVEGELPEALHGDAARLRQVLTNLLGNAIKFTARGGVELVLQVSAAANGAVALRFDVSDSGIGIAPDALERLFQPFAQADSSTTRRYGGTGLGLSIVKQLTELMGGRVSVRSQPGVGSIFTVELTMAEADAGLLPRSAQDAADPQALQGVRVLVVDDSDINREVARRTLELHGARVCEAADGAVAVERLLADPGAFDVVLMDVQMPGMDGHEATRRLRQRPELRDLPVIALTAGVTVSEQVLAAAAGMNDVQGKPFDPPALVARIRRHAGLPSSRPPTAASGLMPLAAVEAEPGPEWPAIEGLDIAAVRRRLGGDAALFRSMLGRLLARHRDLSALLPQQDAQWAPLAAALHHLKGNAGTLGGRVLHQAAAQAEDACRSRDAAALGPRLARLDAELDALRLRAAPWLTEASPEPDPEVPPPAAERVRALLLRLRAHDFEACQLFDELLPALAAHVEAGEVTRWRAWMDELQFEPVADALERRMLRVASVAAP